MDEGKQTGVEAVAATPIIGTPPAHSEAHGMRSVPERVESLSRLIRG